MFLSLFPDLREEREKRYQKIGWRPREGAPSCFGPFFSFDSLNQTRGTGLCKRTISE